MAVLGEVFFNVGLNDKGFNSGINKMASSSQGLENMVRKVGSTIAAVFGTAGIMQMVRQSVTAWAEQETALVKLNFAVSQFAGGNKELENRIISLSGEMQNLIGVGDEYTQNLAALGLSYGIEADNIEKATKASIYLSKVTGTDANTIMRGFSQTMEGTVGILGRYIPEVRNLTEEQLRNGEAIDLIINKFEGLDQVLSTTMQASMDRFKASLGDVGEVLGQKLSPFLAKAADLMSQFSKDVSEAGSVLVVIKDYALNFLSTLSPLGKGILTVITAFVGLKIGAAAWNILSNVIVTGGRLIINIFSSIFSWPALLIAGMYLLRVAWDHDWFGMRTTLENSWQAMKNAWGGAWDNLNEIWNNPDLEFLEKVAASIGMIASDIWHGVGGAKGFGTIWKDAWQELVRIWQDPDLTFLQKIGNTFEIISGAIWDSAVTIGAAFTKAFGGDSQKYVETMNQTLENLKKSWYEFLEAPDLATKFEKGFEFALDVYELPAKFILSGFEVDNEALNGLINVIATTLGIKFITGSWVMGIGISMTLQTLSLSRDFATNMKEQMERATMMATDPVARMTATSFQKAFAWALSEEPQSYAYKTAKQIQNILSQPGEIGLLEGLDASINAALLRLEYFSTVEIKDVMVGIFGWFRDLWQGIGDWFRNFWQNIADWWNGLFKKQEQPQTWFPSPEYLEEFTLPPAKQGGGYTGNVGISTIAGVVHGGEWVAPAWMVNKYGMVISVLEGIRQKGYKKGGFVNGYQNGGMVYGNNEGIDFFGDIKETLMKDIDMIMNVVGNLMDIVKEKFGIDIPNALDDSLNSFIELEAQTKELEEVLSETAETTTTWREKLAETSEIMTYNAETQKLSILGLSSIFSLGKSIIFDFLLSLNNVKAILNPITTIFGALFNILAPMINAILQPLVGLLVSFGQLIAAFLTPIFQALYLALYPLVFTITIVQWAIDQLTLGINALLEWLPFVEGFLTNAQKRELRRSIGERMEEYYPGEGELPQAFTWEEGAIGESVTGTTFQAGSTQEITNNFSFYFSDNMILTEDDESAKRLAQIIVDTLRNQGIEVVT